MYVYVDNAATTAMSKTAVDAMLPYLQETFGNPSSLHTTGQIAKEALEKARKTVADCINADPKEIYFTSGGSEADNQAIVSAANYGAKRGKKHIISSKFEHHAVLHTLKKLEKQGYTVTLLDVNRDGVINPEDVEKAITPETALVTIMFANNEIGTIQPVAEIGEICKKHKVLFHTDAVQAAGHIKVDVKEIKADMISVSGHKFHGPKGTGFLYARKGIVLSNIIDGGAQERGKRAGTENLPAIVGMAAALKDACDNMKENAAKMSAMRDKLITELVKIPHSIINGSTEKRLPGNVNISFEGIEGESLLLLLDSKGIEASSGSACASGSLEPSHVLLSIGLPKEVAHGSLRISLGETNTMEQMDYIIQEIPQIVEKLRDISPVWEDLVKGKMEHVI